MHIGREPGGLPALHKCRAGRFLFAAGSGTAGGEARVGDGRQQAEDGRPFSRSAGTGAIIWDGQSKERMRWWTR